MSDLKEIKLTLNPKIFSNFFDDDASFQFADCRPIKGKGQLEQLLEWFFFIQSDINQAIYSIGINNEGKIIIELGSEYTLEGGGKDKLDLTLTITPGTFGATYLRAEGAKLKDLFKNISGLRGIPPPK